MQISPQIVASIARVYAVACAGLGRRSGCHAGHTWALEAELQMIEDQQDVARGDQNAGR